jgi:hypothetical protein
VALTEEGTAWCADVSKGIVYQYHLSTGFVLDQYETPNAWEVIAANREGAWFGGQPASQFNYVSGGESKEQDLNTLINGALGAGNAFWFLDGTRRLHIYDGQKAPERLSMQDGLLEDTALVVKSLPDESVWVGSSKGVSRLDPETGEWQTFGRDDGVQGAVIDIAAGPDGTVWLLNYMLLNRKGCWANAYDPGDEWRHISLSRLTGLSAPRDGDAIAVDGLGRLWFVALSISDREKFLGVLSPDGTLAYSLYSLGPYPTDGPFYEYGLGTLPGPFGVLSDGDGGIYLYNGRREPLRHWRP